MDKESLEPHLKTKTALQKIIGDRHQFTLPSFQNLLNEVIKLDTDESQNKVYAGIFYVQNSNADLISGFKDYAVSIQVAIDGRDMIADKLVHSTASGFIVAGFDGKNSFGASPLNSLEAVLFASIWQADVFAQRSDFKDL
ncbi:hypothetical protein LEP1GSC191_2771 [Leptospira borgpetersenii serovar Mini str. 201000851]|nr:hypothetical protein LEP1GSC191_2771 [Leptospira borgpetersenii serovar Mini str. 201000851]